jgi:hypothetical protein
MLQPYFSRPQRSHGFLDPYPVPLPIIPPYLSLYNLADPLVHSLARDRHAATSGSHKDHAMISGLPWSIERAANAQENRRAAAADGVAERRSWMTIERVVERRTEAEPLEMRARSVESRV